MSSTLVGQIVITTNKYSTFISRKGDQYKQVRVSLVTDSLSLLMKYGYMGIWVYVGVFNIYYCEYILNIYVSTQLMQS